MSELSEVVGRGHVLSFLKGLESMTDVVEHDRFRSWSEDAGLDGDTVDMLIERGLLHKAGAGYYFSTKGRAVTLLLKAVNGEIGFRSVEAAMSELYPTPRPYELIEGHVTEHFIQMLEDRPGFSRLRICSPWISLDAGNQERIRRAVAASDTATEQVDTVVVTLPKRRYRDKAGFDMTLGFLRELGADIVVNRQLHAKLYICEPGVNGRFHYAIFGSENLTGQGNVELAVCVEGDTYMIRRLTEFFETVYACGEPLTEEAT